MKRSGSSERAWRAQIDLLGRHATADLCSAHAGVRSISVSIAPLWRGIRLHGEVVTAETSPGENAAVHRAVDLASEGTVVVVAGGDLNAALFGELLAHACLARGVRGVVVEGAVRDAARLRRLRFPVFCSGLNPCSAGKADPGRIGEPLHLSGVELRPGDVLVGDDDGVVVVEKSLVAEVADAAGKRLRWEATVRERIETGESTCDIFGIKH